MKSFNQNSKPDENAGWDDSSELSSCSVCGANPTHRPSVYFVELALPMNFKNRTSAHASIAAAALLKFARKAI